MNSIDQFIQNPYVDDLLDDDSVLLQVPQLKDFLYDRQDLLATMINYLQIDPSSTDYRLAIQYPFMVSEILSQIMVFKSDNIRTLLLLFKSDSPEVVLGYFAKIFMRILQEAPVQFWKCLTELDVKSFLQSMHHPLILENVYSMIVFQSDCDQMEMLEQRKALFYMVLDLLDRYPDQVIEISIMIFKKTNDQDQEQKIYFRGLVQQNQERFLQIIPTQSKVLLVIQMIIQYDQNLLIRIIQSQNQLYHLLDSQGMFGQNRLYVLQFLEIISGYPEQQQNIELVQILLSLMQRHPNNNQLHLSASNIIINNIPRLQDNESLVTQLSQLIKSPSAYRGYILKILNTLSNNQSLQPDVLSVVVNLNSKQENYLLGVIPEKSHAFNLQEEYESAIQKLEQSQI